MTDVKKYILDANCFIEPWNKFYSYDFFDAFWDNFIKGRCDDKTVLIQEEIYDEIMKKSDELNAWVKKHNFEIVKTDPEITRSATKIQNQFPKLVKEITGRSLADPFIIALAQREGATVVTLEDKGTEAKPKIPFVCDALKVKQAARPIPAAKRTGHWASGYRGVLLDKERPAGRTRRNPHAAQSRGAGIAGRRFIPALKGRGILAVR